MMRVGEAEKESGAPSEPGGRARIMWGAGWRKWRRALWGWQSDCHSRPVVLALQEMGPVGARGLRIKSGQCSAQRLICVVGWSPARWVKCADCSDLCVSWPRPPQTWPGGGLGSVNIYNLSEGHLERDFDGHNNSITLEPDTPSWENPS